MDMPDQISKHVSPTIKYRIMYKLVKEQNILQSTDSNQPLKVANSYLPEILKQQLIEGVHEVVWERYKEPCISISIYIRGAWVSDFQ